MSSWVTLAEDLCWSLERAWGGPFRKRLPNEQPVRAAGPPTSMGPCPPSSAVQKLLPQNLLWLERLARTGLLTGDGENSLSLTETLNPELRFFRSGCPLTA